jgi:hypothetical protein
MAAMGNGDEIDSEVIDSDDDDDDESSDGDGLDNSSDSEDDLDDSEEDNDDDKVDDEIMDKFMRTFSNGDYDAEFDNALICPDRIERVTLPARRSQASYITPNNWRERNRDGLEKVKSQLQNLVEAASHGPSLRIIMMHNSIGDQQLMENEEPIVWHEPILDEYWDQLETEIDRRKQLGIVTKIENINIVNIEMKKEHLTTLVAITSATNSSTYLNFDNANLCEQGIISLSKLVDLCSELQCFSLYHNRIDIMDSARCLSRSLKSHTCIEELHLHHCDLGSSPEILSVILQSDVEYITLVNNNIDSLGAVKIAEYLESNPPIGALSLSYNRLNDDDAILISQALKRNTKLCNLWLHSNNITSIGVKVLLTRVFDSSSLNSISESNHTMKQLVAMKIFSEENNKKLQGFIDGMLQLDRTQKIMLALQNKDSLLKYLTNVPVELIPEILRFPQRVVNQPQHKHLNIVNSTMRWWNMPMLYSYHHNCCLKPDSKRKRDD